MVRARSGKTVTRGRKRMRKLTKGFRLSRHNLYRQSAVTLIRSRVYAFRDRRVRKREFRRLWIVRINAACRMRGSRYSEFMTGLQRAHVALDRKTLADLAVKDPDAFTKLVELARANVPAPATTASAGSALEVAAMAGRKERVLVVLEQHGVVRRGTEIEMVPAVLPSDAGQHDPRAFRATIVDPAGLRQSIRWALDGELYSLSELTRVVRDRFGATPNVGLYFSNWRRVGVAESLHHEAERFPR